METIKIKTFSQLIEYFNRPEVTKEQIIEIISKSLTVFIISTEATKEIIILEIIDFWAIWGNTKERPFFIDID